MGNGPLCTLNPQATQSAPRTCGDGPAQREAENARRTCSPHPRGWSRAAVVPQTDRDLLPAPAGMVPWGGRPGGAAAAAPRTRGDGPRETAPLSPSQDCSPHPRGWSLASVQSLVETKLLPAPAGMVPATTRTTLPTGPAPRTRGDGPEAITQANEAMNCFPHPRGWSRRRTPCPRQDRLLPAPAGMVPRPGTWSSRRLTAPRTRGDGPTEGSCGAHRKGCSPHPRGWSRPSPRPARCCRLLPAPAGMVPAPSRRRSRCRPAPRTRGDGPDGR
ncbi:hypothetical protein D3C57_109360 [Streptomyces rapamycinicus NRRL 5491]|uniref:Uncharacterized protein n=1 Tax=Streptomyces rapamycinicus (strain ATCC 29253 / DSM 41530 / NRRL 5491 / AYB-994) TaxID=1343740 RepID=A0A3L8RFQ0_STRRN|nr:hypothetical protein D3C57_109360 [Streptomyces rapamycinicus NRRL 5491]